MQKLLTFQNLTADKNAEYDDAKSEIAKRYEDTRKIESLLNKLSDYIKFGKNELGENKESYF